MGKRKALAIAMCVALGGSGAQANELGEFGEGMLVPRAYHNGTADTTAVGLIWSCEDDTDGGTVYWTFFDVNSNHVTDGQIPMTQNDRYGFVWANESGVGLEGVEGYLVFVADSDNDGALTGLDEPCLMGEAFHVVSAEADVAFVPTWQIVYNDFNAGAGVPDLTAMNATTVSDLQTGAREGDNTYLHYSIAGGDTTEIVIWSAEAIGGPGVVYTVNIFDDEQNRKSVNLPLPNEELNVVDPSSLAGLPASFLNGFILWNVPTGPDPEGDGNGVATYSVIRSPAFNARQTIINPHTK